MVTHSCRYDQNNPQFYNTPTNDDVPLLNDDLMDDEGGGRGTGGQSVASSLDDHCHLPQPSKRGSRRAITRLLVACCLTTVFMVGEVVGGYYAGSIAIMSDAAHLMSDLTSFLVSLGAIHLAMRPASRKMSYGYHRAEVLGAVVSVLIIWVVTGVLVYAAAQRVISMDFTVHGDTMIVVSALGVLMNIVLGFILHAGQGGHGHGHSHGLGSSGSSNRGDGGNGVYKQESNEHVNTSGREVNHGSGGDDRRSRVVAVPRPQTTANEDGVGIDGSNGDVTVSVSHAAVAAAVPMPPPSGDNVNIRAAFIHVLGDLIQSVGVLVAAYIIRYYPEYKVADPICTFMFSILVLFTTAPIIRDLSHVLMEGVPPGVDYVGVCANLAALPGVRAVHSLHVWTLTLDKNACSVHLAVDQSCSPDDVLRDAQRVIRSRHHIYHTTIQVERYNQAFMDNCNDCQPLL